MKRVQKCKKKKKKLCKSKLNDGIENDQLKKRNNLMKKQSRFIKIYLL